jgi:hypothetical protein
MNMADQDTPVKVEESNELKPTNVEWLDRARIKAEVEVEVRAAYESIFKLWKLDELDKVRKESEDIAKEGIEKLFAKWKEEQKPPSHDDIQLLLGQEYETFTLKLDSMDASGEEQSEMFTIRELPQAAEKKFYRQFKDKILSKAGALEAFTQAGIDKPFEEKAKAFLDLFEDSFDMLADAVVIVLNPFNKKQLITRDWVQNNISSNRQWQMVEAQIQVNKLKDFFSRLSQSGQTTQMMLGGLNFQQLQQQVRS